MRQYELSEKGKKHLENHPIQGVIFDMDGVILDSEKLYTRFWVEAGKALGFPMELKHGLYLRSLDHETAAACFIDWFGPEAVYQDIRNKRIELMNVYIEEHGVEAKPGIAEILDYLEEKNIPFCIATASPQERCRKYLTQVGFNDRFPTIITAYEVEHGKPAPDIYLAAAKKIGVAPENCIGIEDSYNGLRSAATAGMMAIMVPDQDQPNEEMWGIIGGKALTLADIIGILEEGN